MTYIVTALGVIITCILLFYMAIIVAAVTESTKLLGKYVVKSLLALAFIGLIIAGLMASNAMAGQTIAELTHQERNANKPTTSLYCDDDTFLIRFFNNSIHVIDRGPRTKWIMRDMKYFEDEIKAVHTIPSNIDKPIEIRLRIDRINGDFSLYWTTQSPPYRIIESYSGTCRIVHNTLF